MDPSTLDTSISSISIVNISASKIVYIFASKVVHIFASKIDLYSANLFLTSQIVHSSNMEDICTLSYKETRPGPVTSLYLKKALLHPFQESTYYLNA